MNPNKEWVDKHLIIATSSITIGNNFDIENVYDKIYLYASSISRNLVRDMFQSTYRIRHLKDNELHYCLDTILKGINADTYPCNQKVIKEGLEHKEKIIKDIDESVYEEFKSKDYIVNLYVNNLFEHNLSIMYMEDMFNYYLKECNYVRDLNNVMFLNGMELMNLPMNKIEYHNIPEIDNDKYKELMYRDSKSLTDIERASMKKFQFLGQINIEGLSCQAIKKLWNGYCEHSKKFHHISIEKNINHNVCNIMEFRKHVYNVFQSNTVIKYNAVMKMIHILGIDNTQVYGEHISRDSINQVCELFNTDEDYIKLFGIKKIENEKDKSVQNTLRRMNQILNYWGFSQVKSAERKQKKINGKKLDVSDFILTSTIDVYSVMNVLKVRDTKQDKINGEYLANVNMSFQFENE